jgi:hypothetical protein
MRRAAAAVAAALVLAVPAALADSGVTWSPASPRNYGHQHRPGSAIRLVVIHATEGSYWGTISWFGNPRARASANYVVGRSGAVTQMVSLARVAWHSGNSRVNWESVGIEHEGYVYAPWTFTDAQYRASARVTASILRAHVLPIDRRHVIGHSEVPDPAHPWLGGGRDHHTDPGRYWDWTRYMAYVRAYAAGNEPPARPFDVAIPLALSTALSGPLHLEPTLSGDAADHVDLAVDGKTVATAKTPFALDLDTRTVANGTHSLVVHAVSATGLTADAGVRATVTNQPPPKLVDAAPWDGDTVSGVVTWTVFASGSVARVELLVDGVLRDTARRSPWVGTWDATKDAPGPHQLTFRVVGAGGVATRTVTVVVAPAPPPAP